MRYLLDITLLKQFAFIAVLCCTQAVRAQSQEIVSPPKLPLTITRYDERWDHLAYPAAGNEHWTDRFKYIPIGPDAYLTTGLELRARTESFHENLWGSAIAPNDSYLWLRAMPYADLHIGADVVGFRTFVQPIIAYEVGVAPEAGPIDQTRADLLQGFFDVSLGSEAGSTDGLGVTLRAGRQMLSLGSERLVGTRYGPNVPLAFDGFRALLSMEGATVSFLATQPVDPGLGSFDDERSRSETLWGVYSTISTIGLSSGLDLYWLGFQNTEASFGGSTGQEDRHSFGARLFGDSKGWHWNVEGVYQTGRFNSDTISAWTLGTEFGHSFDDLPMEPDAVLRINVVSGDRRAGDGRLNTFNALYPKGKYFGELSPIGPTNIISINPRIDLKVNDTVTASIAGMAYWRYSLEDGVYDVPGNLVRGPGESNARFIGRQAEATLSWHATPELELSTSISVFAPGAFIRQTGSSKTIGMLGFEANFRF